MKTKFSLIDKRHAERVFEFNTLNELLDAGWAVD